MSDPAYTPPKVWQPKENGGRFAKINRPTAGAREERALPEGEHRFQLHSLATPNGVKVTVMFEELLEAGHEAEYDAYPIDISEGEQFGSGFVALNPNSKIPALYDRKAGTRVFESGAILLHLAEQFGAFLPKGGPVRAETLSWLMWQMGSAPFLGGGFGHFYAYAPEKYEYPIDRYAMEAKRQMDVLDRRLAEHEWLNGEGYSVADIAVWPWYGALALGKLYDAAEFLEVASYTSLVAWAERVAARPAVRRRRHVNRTFGPEEGRVPERHGPGDFDA